MAHLEFFDPRLVALMAEVRHHPDLVKKIAEAEENGKNAHSLIFTYNSKTCANVDLIRTAEEGYGFIAAYVGIHLDGDYTLEDIYNVCDAVRERLEEKRVVIVNSVDPVEEAVRKENEGKVIITPKYMH